MGSVLFLLSVPTPSFPPLYPPSSPLLSDLCSLTDILVRTHRGYLRTHIIYYQEVSDVSPNSKYRHGKLVQGDPNTVSSFVPARQVSQQVPHDWRR